MNICVYESNGKGFVHVEYINGFAFKTANTRVNCALLPNLCANLGQSVYNSAHFRRLECLSPARMTC